MGADSIDPLIAHLRRCCIHVATQNSATGFFVTPDVVVTCQHVVKANAVGDSVVLRTWSDGGGLDTPKTATVLAVFEAEDLAFLQLEGAGAHPVVLDDRLSVGDVVLGVGFPVRSGRQERDTFTVIYEGRTEYADTSGTAGAESKFKAGQIEHGFSGGPLLNCRTGYVVGVTMATRHGKDAMGGWSVEAATVRRCAAEAGLALPDFDTEWAQLAAPARSTFVGLGSVPLLPAHFIERPTERQDVLEALYAPSAKGCLAISALHGHGGIGKTTLAIDIARAPLTQQHCPDGVLWVSLGQEPQILPLLSGWLAALDAGTPAFWSVESATALLRMALQDRTLLLIIDDIWQAEHARPFLVGGERCRVLVTTRRASEADQIGADTWQLGALKPKEAVRLMGQRAPAWTPDARSQVQAELLADRLGNLPLAVEMVGAMLNRRVELARIDDQITALSESTTALAPSNTVSTAIDACMRLSLNFLKSRHEPTWRNYLLLAMGPPTADVSAEGCALLWAVSVTEASSTLAYLADEAMLTPSRGGYHLHQLMQSVTARIVERPAPDGLGLSVQAAHRQIVDNLRRAAPSGRWDRLPALSNIHSRLIWYLIKAGDITAIEDILSQGAADGRLAWGVACEARGEIASFADDLLHVIAAVARDAPERVDLQLRGALVLASLNSVYSSLTPELLEALVGSGAWSIAEGYHWCGAFADEWRRPAFLIALIRGIQDPGLVASTEGELATHIERLAFQDARELLMRRTANVTTANLLGELIATRPGDQQHDELRRMLDWLEDVAARIGLLQSIRPELRRPFISLIYDEVKAGRSGERRIRQISALLNYMNDDERATAGPDFVDEVENLLAQFAVRTPTTSTAPNHEPPLLLGQTRAECVMPEPTAELWAEPTEIFGPWGEERFVEAVELALIHLDERSLRRLNRLMSRIPGRDARQTLSKAINHLLDLIDRDKKADADDLRASPRPPPPPTLDGAFAHFEAGAFDAGEEVLKATFGQARRHDIERFCRDWLSYWRRLSKLAQDASAKILRELDPTAVGPRAMLSAGLSPDDAAFKVLVEDFRSLDSWWRPHALLVCVSMGRPELVTQVLTNGVPINDRDAQAKALYALMPYLPRDFPESLLAPWRGQETPGGQIAGLVDIMSELVRGLDAEHLAEVVDAASKLHSEWWVVEALTLMLRRLSRAEDFATLLKASRGVANSDLRARLVGRIAIRAVDFEHHDIAIQGVAELPAGPLRSDELHELASTLASLGEVRAAQRAAELIASPWDRDKALLTAAMHLAVQGQIDGARRLVMAIDEEPWISRARQMLESASLNPAGFGRETPQSRRQRRQRDSGSATISLLAQVPDKLALAVPDHPALEAINHAIAAGDQEGVRAGAQRFWTEAPAGEPLVAARLARKTRAELLGFLTDFAPLLDLDHEGQVSQRTLQAIGDAGRWWP